MGPGLESLSDTSVSDWNKLPVTPYQSVFQRNWTRRCQLEVAIAKWQRGDWKCRTWKLTAKCWGQKKHRWQMHANDMVLHFSAPRFGLSFSRSYIFVSRCSRVYCYFVEHYFLDCDSVNDSNSKILIVITFNDNKFYSAITAITK